MGSLNKGLMAVLVALALGLAGSLVWGFYQRGEAKALTVEKERLEGDVAALSRTVEVYTALAEQAAKTGAKQSDARAKAQASVQAVRSEIKKEEANAEEARPVVSAGQLDRLRRLVEAGNAGVRTARELP